MHWILVLAISQISALLINYFADVLPQRMGLTNPLVWLVQFGKFSSLFKQARKVVVHILVALIFVIGSNFPSLEWPSWMLLIVVAYFVLVSVVDIEHRLILHPVSASGAIVFIWFGTLQHGVASTLLGGAIGFSSVFVVYWLSSRALAWVSSKRGLETEEIPFGFGDVILSAVMGFLLGWPGIIAALLLGFFLAGIYSAMLIASRLLRKQYEAFATIPFAPFLSAGAVFVILLAAYS